MKASEEWLKIRVKAKAKDSKRISNERRREERRENKREEKRVSFEMRAEKEPNIDKLIHRLNLLFASLHFKYHETVEFDCCAKQIG